jgi:hypothetical protein
MNYKKHYDLLMNRAKNRVLEGYVEKHHIIPKCLSGSDSHENIAILTPEEHFLAHQLLIKLYPGSRDLIYAAQLMTVHHTNVRVNNKLFGWLRKQCALAMSAQSKKWIKENGHPKGFLGKTHTNEAKVKVIAPLLKLAEEKRVKVFAYNLDGSFYKEYNSIIECAEDLGTSPSNVKYTADGDFGHCRKKQLRYEKVDIITPYKRKPTKTYERTSSHRKEASNRFMKMSTCPHCGLTARTSNIDRWHNDNCRKKL